jgi:hypothetical protein
MKVTLGNKTKKIRQIPLSMANFKASIEDKYVEKAKKG